MSDNTYKVNFSYRHIPTVWKFHECKKKIKAIIGPFGSAKSSGCIMEIFQNGCLQKPDQEGFRRTRFMAVRNTYRQLKDTTMKSFFDWFPPRLFGVYNETDKRYSMEIPLPDKTTAMIEVLFRALDDAEDVANLLSLEVSGAWINEYREIPKIIFDGIDGRVPRYPAEKDGGCDYPMIVMDTNPPDTDHWSYKLFEEDTFKDPQIGTKMQLFKQPSGLSEDAENLPNLAKGYYQDICIGKDDDWIKVYVKAEYGYIKTGKPVYKNYSDPLHCAKEPIEPMRNVPVIIGLDFALNPAAVLTQPIPSGAFNVFCELLGEGMPLEAFLRDILMPVLRSKYMGLRFVVCGDPSGINRSSTDGNTCYKMLSMAGLEAKPAHTNAYQARYAAVDSLLVKQYEGKATFQLSPECPLLRKGFQGEYKFPEHYSYSQRGIVTDLRPLKNLFSHPHDALQYAAMGYQFIEMARETSSKAYQRRKSRPSAETARRAHT